VHSAERTASDIDGTFTDVAYIDDAGTISQPAA
jgi:hypothetical protein